MRIPAHHIRSQVFDISYQGDQSSANDLYHKIKDLFYDVILADISGCLDQHDQQDKMIVFDRVELDLGKISMRELQNELPEKVIFELSRKLADSLRYGTQDYRSLTTMESYAFVIENYLRKGFVSDTKKEDLDQALMALMESSEVRGILMLLKENSSARKRFVSRFSIVRFKDIVQKAEPSNSVFIVLLYECVQATHKRFRIARKSEEDHSRMLWELIISLLMNQAGSLFNAIEFTVSLIRSVAARYNISFNDLLLFLSVSIAEKKGGKWSGVNVVLKKVGEKYSSSKALSGKLNILEKYHFYLSEDASFMYGEYERRSSSEVGKSLEGMLVSSVEDRLIFLRKLQKEPDFIDHFINRNDKNALMEVIKMIEPVASATIVNYHDNLLSIQVSDRLVTAEERAFSQSVWRIILTILLSDKGSRFNHKVFIADVIRKTANRYNLGYLDLLKNIRAASKQLSSRISHVRHFVSLVDEVYTDEFGAERRRSGFDEFKSRNRVKVKPQTELFKILKNSNLYSSISTWKLSASFESFFEKSKDLHPMDDLIDLIRKQDQRRKIFRAMKRKHFKMMLRGFRLPIEMTSLYEKFTLAITRLFSPAHRTYLVLLDNVYFDLLIATRNVNDNTEKFRAELFASLLSYLPVSATVFYDALLAENVRLPDDSRLIRSDKNAETVFDNEEFECIALNLLKFESTDFNKTGCHDIIQLVSFLFENEKTLAKRLTGQMTIPEMRRLVDQLDPVTEAKMIRVYQEEVEYDFLSFIDHSDNQLRIVNHPKVQVIISELRRAFILFSFRPVRFRKGSLIANVYAIIKNYQAETVLRNSIISLPVEGDVSQSILRLETDIQESSIKYHSKETEEKQMINDLIFSKKESVADHLEEPVFIHNAGLVLLHPYLSVLFDRAGLFTDGGFKCRTDREQAVLYLNYILLNKNEYNEENLILNKILCGMNVDADISCELELSPEMKTTASGLLDAFISHWPAIENSSHDGLRGGWFWREGKLTEEEEYFELSVEKKAYDLLMDQLPFTLSPVRYSWMKKSVKVHWR